MFLPGRQNTCVTYFELNYAFEHSMRLIQNDIATNKGAQQLADMSTINCVNNHAWERTDMNPVLTFRAFIPTFYKKNGVYFSLVALFTYTTH